MLTKRHGLMFSLVVLGLILAACGTSTLKSVDDIEVETDALYTIDFEAEDAFETGDFEESSASLAIADGSYQIVQGGESTAYIWGQGGEDAQNVAVEAEATPQSNYSNDLYGVMCRVDDEGAGYAFLVSSDGFGAIARTDGRSLSFLLEWRENDAINSGQTTNTVRGICVDNYLALFVNGELIGDVEDDRVPDAGQAGLITGKLIEAGEEVGDPVTINFDDLTVSDATVN